MEAVPTTFADGEKRKKKYTRKDMKEAGGDGGAA